MDNAQRNLIKKKILKCLTEDFKNNQAIFDKKKGWQCFNGTDLDMVMDKVVKGLEMAKHDIDKGKGEKDLIAGVVDSKRFTETDLLNGYQAGCIENHYETPITSMADFKEIKEDGKKWVKRYTE
jgi:hypothetical protein